MADPPAHVANLIRGTRSAAATDASIGGRISRGGGGDANRRNGVTYLLASAWLDGRGSAMRAGHRKVRIHDA